MLHEIEDVFSFYERFFYKPESFGIYKSMLQFVKFFDEEIVSADMQEEWFYPAWKELAGMSDLLSNIIYIIKRYIFNVLYNNKNVYRLVLFGLLKLKIKRN